MIRFGRILRLKGWRYSMKSILTSIAATGLLAAAAMAQATAQPQPPYTVKDLGTLGGNTSFAFDMNDLGWVAGSANLVASGPQHAFLWYGAGPLKDLGTLGPPHFPACPTCNSEADGPNRFGEAPVASETATYFGPTGEDFCEYGTHHQCLPAIWKNGALTALPTLVGGSSNGAAFGLNNLGQVVGFAENGIVGDSTDPTGCSMGGTPFQKFQFEAVLWEPNGQIRELRPLKGDTVGYAFGNNDFGQSIGASGTCSNTALPPSPSGPHAVLWEADGSPINLGNLGCPPAEPAACASNVASTINDLGEVAGGALSPKDGKIHPFVWTRATGMQEYGVFPGAAVTVGGPCCNTLSNKGELVGFAIDPMGNMRALVWQGKTPIDLNNFIPQNSPLYLTDSASVNDAGQIVGFAIVKSACSGGLAGQAWLTNQGACPVVHAFLATPSFP
jgi:probable HAF family extracellular repeat protein